MSSYGFFRVNFVALDCLLKELSFPSKMNRIGNVQL